MTDRIEALERLARLKAEGVLTDAEFEQQKLVILGHQQSEAARAEAMGIWAYSRQKTRGLRRFFYWFWGIQLFTIVIIAAYFLLRFFIFPEPRQAAATSETNVVAPVEDNVAAPKVESTEPMVGEAEPYASSEVTILDSTLANPWTFDGDTTDGNNSTDVCPGSAVTVINRSSEPLQLQISEQVGTRHMADLPSLEPGMKVTFKAGKVGGYVLTRDLISLYLINVLNCPPQ